MRSDQKKWGVHQIWSRGFEQSEWWWARSCWFWQVVYSDQWAEIQSCRSSVLEDLQSSRFVLEHCEGDLRWSRSESEGRKDRVECHLRRGDGLGNKRKWEYLEDWYTWRRVQDQGRALGTPQEDVYHEDSSVSHLTRKQRDDRYDLNQLKTEPWIPNLDEWRVIKMSWSIVDVR